MREKLAELCHEQWSGWMTYLFSKCYPEVGVSWGNDNETGNLVIPKEFVERWMYQTRTPYILLSEEEKESDRIEADKFLKIFNWYEFGKGLKELPNIENELEKVAKEFQKTEYQKEVEQAYKDGKEIQSFHKDENKWVDVIPCFNWYKYNYRIKQEEIVLHEKLIIAKEFNYKCNTCNFEWISEVDIKEDLFKSCPKCKANDVNVSAK